MITRSVDVMQKAEYKPLPIRFLLRWNYAIFVKIVERLISNVKSDVQYVCV